LSRSSRRRILPTGVLGRSVRNSTTARALVAGQVGLAVLAHLGFGEAGFFLTITSFTASPDLSSGTPTTAHSSTPSASGHHVLDLVRVDVEAAHQDHVLLAVDDLEVAAFVEHADVAALEVAVGRHDLGGLVGALPVAGHHLRALDRDLARLALRHFVAVVVEQLQYVPGIGTPMVPVKAVLSVGLQLADGEVSDRP
jgi:hypothetical protein